MVLSYSCLQHSCQLLLTFRDKIISVISAVSLPYQLLPHLALLSCFVCVCSPTQLLRQRRQQQPHQHPALLLLLLLQAPLQALCM